jgi:colicin import membrane protein
MDSFSPEVLLALQALLAKELASRGAAPAASVAKPAKAPKVSKEAKEPAVKRAPGAWAAWTKHCPLTHAAEYAEFKASATEKQGIAPLFCTQWRKDHAEEYAAFEAAHKASAAEPAASAEPSPASAPSPAAAPPAKEKRKWSEEAKVKAAAKRAAKKAGDSVASVVAEFAAIAAAAPAPLPAAPPAAPPAARAAAPLPSFALRFDEEAGRVRSAAPSQGSNAAASASAATSKPYNPFAEEDEDEEEDVELLPFKLGGRTYLRPGFSRPDGQSVWATGDLWESKKGLRGDWAGALQQDGSIDMDAEEPDFV